MAAPIFPSHRLGPVVVVGLAMVLAPLALTGCDAETAIDLLEKTAEAPTPPTASLPESVRTPGGLEPAATQTASLPPGPVMAVPPRDLTKLRIGTFNLQAFGPTKASRPHVMAILAGLVQRFDVLAIQEIRSKDQLVFPRLVEAANRAAREAGSSARFDFVVGERLGHTVSKEQYAYIFDAARVEIFPRSVYTLPDVHEDFHREPLVATFQTRVPTGRQPFRFTLINIHTDPSPDAIDWELDRLDDVLRAIAGAGSGEDDLILLGDLNADDKHLGELGQMRHIMPTLRARATNTRKTAMYDNIIVHRVHTNEWTGAAGVIDFPAEYGLSLDEALEVSDHLPVWADFSPLENIGQLLSEQPMSGQPVLVR